jgi:hypothetical protein
VSGITRVCPLGNQTLLRSSMDVLVLFRVFVLFFVHPADV